jgi:hypothetical protein
LDQATFAYMVDADLSFAEARKLAQTDLKPETLTLSPGEIAVDANTREVIATGEEIAPDMTAAQNEANDLFTKGAVNPDTQKPFTSYAEALVWKLNSGKADTNINVNTGTEGQAVPAAWVEAEKSLVANGQMFVRKLNPDTNQFDFVLGEDGMPTIMDIPGGKAAADVAATEAKTAQIVQQTDIDAATSPLELQALRDTLTKNALDIEQQIANAPDQQAELKARAAKAETDRLQAELNYKEALSMEGLTAKEREVALEKANAERDNAVLTTEKLSRELADSETGKQALSLRHISEPTRQVR